MKTQTEIPLFRTSAAMVKANKAQAAAEAANTKPRPPTEADLIAALREAKAAGVTLKVVDGRVEVDAPLEAGEYHGKLATYPDDMVIDLWHAHQRYTNLMAAPALWDNEADEVMALARRFGYQVVRQRVDIEIVGPPGFEEPWYDVDETPALGQNNLNEKE